MNLRESTVADHCEGKVTELEQVGAHIREWESRLTSSGVLKNRARSEKKKGEGSACKRRRQVYRRHRTTDAPGSLVERSELRQ